MKQAIIEALANNCEFCAVGWFSAQFRSLQAQFHLLDQTQLIALINKYL